MQVVGLKMEVEDGELETDQEGLSIAAGINQNLPEQVKTPQTFLLKHMTGGPAHCGDPLERSCKGPFPEWSI